jgi:hypothetical protein
VRMVRRIPRLKAEVVPTGQLPGLFDPVDENRQFLVSWASMRPKTGESGFGGVILTRSQQGVAL